MNKVKVLSVISTLLCLIIYNVGVRRAPIKSLCPEGVILTVKQGGNSSNNVWEYLSVVSLSKLYPEKRFVAYIPDGMKEVIKQMFEETNTLQLSELPFQCISNINFERRRYIHLEDSPGIVQRIDEKFVQLVVLAKYSARYEEILEYGVENVKRELRFKQEDVQRTTETLNGIKRKFSLSEPTYIGVHYRGGDYVDLLRRVYRRLKGISTYRYYKRAMRHFEDVYENAIFIFVTTDSSWLNENLEHFEGRVVVSPYVDDKVKDMALLAHCNHTIINYGTFGVTGALLNGGTTIVYDLEVPLDHRGMTLGMGIAGILKNWMLLK